MRCSKPNSSTSGKNNHIVHRRRHTPIDTCAMECPALQSISPISVEDLERFAVRSAPRNQTIQCRITRDRRGVEKGMYPTYYLHMEKDDGKRVGPCDPTTCMTCTRLVHLQIVCSKTPVESARVHSVSLSGVSDGWQEEEEVQNV